MKKMILVYMVIGVLSSTLISSCGKCEDNLFNQIFGVYNEKKCQYEPDEEVSADSKTLKHPPSPLDLVNQSKT